MNIGKLTLFFYALFFVLFAVNAFGWIAVSPVALGIVALILAVLLFIQFFSTP